MNDEQKKLAVDVWSKIIGTQEHFNEIIMQVRNYLLTIITAIVGASAFAIEKKVTVTLFCREFNIAFLILVAGLIILSAFYITERGYHQLLIGAVKQGERIETEFASDIPGIKLTHSISDESKKRICMLPLRSLWRVRAFYLILALLLVLAAIVTLKGVHVVP